MAKAVVFDRRGRLVAKSSRRLPVDSPHPGWMERDAAATWDLTAATVREAISGLETQIAAVGVTGCGNGAVCVDEDLRPVRAGVLSSDTRARALVSDLPRAALQTPYPGQTTVLWRWLELNEPHVARGARHVLFWKDFIRAQLTGEACVDVTDAGAAGLIDPRTRAWRPGFERGTPLRESLTLAGAVRREATATTGLPSGLPVAVGCADFEAAAIGDGVIEPGMLSIVAGTWAINQALVAAPLETEGLFLCNPSAQRGRWLALDGGPTSASHFDWFARNICLDGHEALVELAASARSGPIFIPRLFDGAGAFLGLRNTDTRAELSRAVMQGVTFSHRQHVERLRAAGLTFDRARLSGGAKFSAFWVQMFADALGLPIECSDVTEPGALGAALIAGVATESWSSLAAAHADLTTRLTAYVPGESQDGAYDNYLQNVARLA